MSEKRFKLTKINPTVNLSDTVYFIIDYENPNKEIRTLKDCVGLLNEQQATISALKDIFKDIVSYSKWDSEKPYCSLGITVDKKTYYKIREILNE